MAKRRTLEKPEIAQDAPECEISIRGLTKRFGKQTILEGLTFDIPKGKVTLILGPSGTGKSVFLKNVMGLLKPEEGEIWIGDKNVPALGHKQLYEVRRKFGVLFQDGALFGSMTVYDNTAFPLREHTKKSEKEIKGIVMEKLEMVGLIGAEGKLPGEISGGMKKRAGLARALVLDPQIIMFDEPDSGLDPVRTAFLNELILELNRQLGATMIVVTHDIATARRVADYIGMLYLRNLVKFDSKENMFNSDIPVVRQFLAGATEGPIGMSEEADQGRQGGQAPRSTSGMTAAEVEEIEREAGAPPDGELNGGRTGTAGAAAGARSSRRRSRTLKVVPEQEESAEGQAAPEPAEAAEQAEPEAAEQAEPEAAEQAEPEAAEQAEPEAAEQAEPEAAEQAEPEAAEQAEPAETEGADDHAGAAHDMAGGGAAASLGRGSVPAASPDEVSALDQIWRDDEGEPEAAREVSLREMLGRRPGKPREGDESDQADEVGARWEEA